MSIQTYSDNRATVLTLSEKTEVTNRKQVGILGGNFNPVHLAHLMIADQVGQGLGLDTVFLMPSYLPPHVDEKKTIDAEHRLAMLELAVEENPLLAIETIELDRKGKSYTYDTMKTLTESNPNTDYYFIIGGDMVEYLPKWHRIDELLELVNFVGIKRPEFGTETPYPIIWVDVPEIDLSSSSIRKKVKNGCSVRYLVPDKVREYIQEKRLYLNEE
ncbi:nicotinate (nicotinamide) nucleotide adenylyltransferase [Enterococcus phoeniculicola]|uniref:Probable nicotinate-nucleotide adenylyltransferase n=1 Tax=Enterococcus phoeniculicola ATCC BAA-412 TaxID=1158610 RepID=R3U163_9ENTE|nr:nicotinate-nucleotide adenylyltransferase [Enterococcus phoeniculicola]EOL47589.1 nicotinate (nicotinamide) nucleotide adenylyltransferase [Enterococcus phoeniculicola ATCC BAA-412]EOT72884.1 nicotinate (nicotinamide) nucleotide adenylyltransferase [Enterococcus phoeniculicola ATCC BAA-412]OJG71376.1 nicotinate (nicotinamide) nucleotide adenylyltransferase [Enterococcus phoeniculicola]